MSKVVDTLVRTPVSAPEYQAALKAANNNEIREAIAEMGNSGILDERRRVACMRELRRRGR